MNGRRFALTGLVTLCALAGLLALSSVPALAGKRYLPAGSFGGEGAGDGQFVEPAGVAVNDSSEPLVEPAAGDVYVVDKGHNRVERFTAAGAYVSQFDGSATPAGSFSGPELIAVDDSASALDPAVWDVYVGDSGHNVVDRFSASGEYLGQLTGTCASGPCTGEEAFGELHGVAVDPSGNVWVYQGEGNVDEFSSAGVFLKTFNTGRGAQPAMAVDSSGNVYVVSGDDHVLRFDSATGEQLAEFDLGALAVALDPASGNLLVDRGADIDLFDPSPNSNSTPLQTFTGAGLAESRGIAAGAASNVYASDRSGEDVQLFNSVLVPGASAEAASQLSETSETLHGTVNPEGEEVTACRFEYAIYGTEAGVYPHTASCDLTPAEIGSATAGVHVSAELSGLQRGATYRFRLVAVNANGSGNSSDETFVMRSPGAPGVSLPDERAYEKVSAFGNGEVYAPESDASAEVGDTKTGAPFRAAAGGGAMVYAGGPPGSGVGGNGNQISGSPIGNEYLAKRTSAGWTAGNIEPPQPLEGGSFAQYQAFSSDLSLGFFSSTDQPPLAGAPAHCNVLYARSSSDGAFAALLTGTLTPGSCGHPLFAGASADGSRSFFQSEAALSPGAVAAQGSETEFCLFDCNLYESSGGALSLVNLLPGGGVDANATFGSPSDPLEEPQRDVPDVSNAISADGSRVFWTDVSSNIVYMRKDGASTVQVSAGAAEFWTASVDGRFAFYTEGEKLLRFDVESGTRVELAGAGAGVQGVAGVSDDGSYVYFVADGALASGATSQTCSGEASGGGCNLYVLHTGESTRLVATLAPSDNHVPGTERHIGDWQPYLGFRTAEVSPNGRGIAFSSIRPLTGYDNRLQRRDNTIKAMPEVFVYEYGGGGELFCASCDPTGALPSKSPELSLDSTYAMGGFDVPSLQSAYMLRWVSEDGARVFFDTAQPLVARDTNGRADVYEWERQDAGSCRQAGGCVFLLSGGSSSDQSFFMDAGTSGDDVYFMTRAQLVPEDRDGTFDLYDARVDGGFSGVAAPGCTGAGCQDVQSAAAASVTPSSVTFSGAGNLSPPGPAVRSKPKAKPRRCGRGLVRRHGRCVRKAKAKTTAKGSGKRAKRGRK